MGRSIYISTSQQNNAYTADDANNSAGSNNQAVRLPGLFILILLEAHANTVVQPASRAGQLLIKSVNYAPERRSATHTGNKKWLEKRT